MDIPREVLEAFKNILGTSTLHDDPMDFRRIPKIQTEQIKTEKPRGK